MTKLCPFRKTTTTRIVSDTETVVDEEFCVCDEGQCMAYFPYEAIQCTLMKKNR